MHVNSSTTVPPPPGQEASLYPLCLAQVEGRTSVNVF